MSRTNRNFVIAYVLLVGLPVGGLVGVLKAGRTLNAPISVDGTWRIQTAPLASFPCPQFLGSVQDVEVVISQSGKNLVMELNNGSKANGPGMIAGTTLTALVQASAASAGEKGCGNDHVLALTATVDAKAEPRSLIGMLSIPGCRSCAPVEFRASQVRRDSSKGAH